MPKPKGWSDEALAKRDRCVEHLKAKGYDESSAYAICTSMVEKTGPHDKHGPGK
jgi:hypothetical protein